MIWDIILVVIGAALYFGIGMLWYSPNALGKTWADIYGHKLEDQQPTPYQFGGAAIVALLVSAGLLKVIDWSGSTTLWEGLCASFTVWLTFVASIGFSGVLWCKRPLNGYFVDTGCLLVAFLVVGALFGIYR